MHGRAVGAAAMGAVYNYVCCHIGDRRPIQHHCTFVAVQRGMHTLAMHETLDYKHTDHQTFA